MNCDLSVPMFRNPDNSRSQSLLLHALKNAAKTDLSNKLKLAGKPGSVVDSHSSRRFVT
jgi:hypothetical protein